jgi:two-component system sensor histidine kinase KdpD
MTQDARDPDKWLSRVELEEKKTSRGKLKIFFGASAGVGKTFAMLQSAQKQKSEGVDVVVGYVETHGRKETEALLSGLEVLPRAKVAYRQTTLEEFDIDAASARKPQLLLVDELAHSNAPGSRHAKRWQDVEELLEAGINVYTTMNVQHVESLHDLVAQITRVSMRERVPDSFLEQSAEYELIDIAPDELLQRLNEGKVYIPEQAQEALRNFFQKGNLIALRELALRFTAERVVEQMQEYRDLHAIRATWPASERIVVCVSASPLSERLVRAAKRMATALHAQWLAVYVEGPREMQMSQMQRDRAAQTLHLAEQLGADTLKLTGDDPAGEITKCARQFNASKIVIGKPARPRWKEFLFGSVVDTVIRQSGEIDVYVITGDPIDPAKPRKRTLRTTSTIQHYLRAIAVVMLCTLVGNQMFGHFDPSNVVMIYLLGIVYIATRHGRGPSIMASILSVLTFDFFLVPPRYTFAVSDGQYFVTFAVMLVVALVVSTLMTRIKRQAQTARLREMRTGALYSMSRELSSSLDERSLIEIGLRHISEQFQARVGIATANGDDQLGEVVSAAEPYRLTQFDRGIAMWVHKNRQRAGAGTDTLPAGEALYVPLLGADEVVGVLAICTQDPRMLTDPDQMHLLDTFANQIALACERAHLADEYERAHVQVKAEQLRNSLLSSVSHDLRTPLATITGAASSIIEGSERMDLRACKDMASEIFNESVRLNKLVSNLLDMTKLESGAINLHLQPHPVDEIVGAALAWIDDRLGDRLVTTNVPEELPFVLVDSTLIQQVLVNLLENAVKYTAPSSTIDIKAVEDGQHVIVTVSDNGPGIPAEHRQLVFEKFYKEAPGTSGVGLGLAICKSIIEAHGGKIWIEESTTHGAAVRFTLKSAPPPKLLDTDDDEQ